MTLLRIVEGRRWKEAGPAWCRAHRAETYHQATFYQWLRPTRLLNNNSYNGRLTVAVTETSFKKGPVCIFSFDSDAARLTAMLLRQPQGQRVNPARTKIAMRWMARQSDIHGFLQVESGRWRSPDLSSSATTKATLVGFREMSRRLLNRWQGNLVQVSTVS